MLFIKNVKDSFFNFVLTCDRSETHTTILLGIVSLFVMVYWILILCCPVRVESSTTPETIEAKVLYDADKLDSIGAVGVGRDFLFAGYLKNALYTGRERELVKLKKDRTYTEDDTAILEYEFKLKKIKNKMLTGSGKKIAQKRHDFMTLFFKKFWLEVEGRE